VRIPFYSLVNKYSIVKKNLKSFIKPTKCITILIGFNIIVKTEPFNGKIFDEKIHFWGGDSMVIILS